MRYMFIVTSASAMGPTPELLQGMHALATREITAGRMLDDGGLAPLDTGARIVSARGKVAVLDGPFAETKEVIGGYAIFEVNDRAEGLALAVEFMQLHADHMPDWQGVCEMREIAGSQTKGG